MQQRFRPFDPQGFRSVEVASEPARQLVDAKVELGCGAACDIAEACNKQAFHHVILAA